MSLAHLIHSLAAELQLPALSLSPNGSCQIVIDSKMAVTIEDASLERCVHFYATVGLAPASSLSEFFATLLEAQLFGREIGEGCSFGYARTTSEIVLCRKLSLAGMTESEFAQAMTEFINWTEHWSDKLSQVEPPDRPAGDGFTHHEHFIRA